MKRNNVIPFLLCIITMAIIAILMTIVIVKAMDEVYVPTEEYSETCIRPALARAELNKYRYFEEDVRTGIREQIETAATTVIEIPVSTPTTDTLPLTTTPTIVQETEKPFADKELEMLAITIYKEAGADSISDKVRLMVGTVVLNRVADSRFPNTIEEVLTQPSQYSDFSRYGIRWPERANNPNEAHAVERAYRLAERLLSGERALPPDVVFQAEFKQGKEVVACESGIYFCR